jgi:hypothetical protein
MEGKTRKECNYWKILARQKLLHHKIFQVISIFFIISNYFGLSNTAYSNLVISKIFLLQLLHSTLIFFSRNLFALLRTALKNKRFENLGDPTPTVIK